MAALNKKWLTGLVTGALMAASASVLAAEQKTLHVYNWSDYIAPDTVANFEKETGLKSCTTYSTPTRCWKAN
ncbi:Putrescine-binding periplasmic protein precursor [Kluyvera cryocrescens]|uniref:Putrescine-binding periplasmic protein n=1 Tax=Kluyvera cryocrescens TaxID=580 RepID=A0A485ACD7_KLUCR|nr:Putrescine-binding periplasmic protein precursor [Kluyvera cryocrescens]